MLLVKPWWDVCTEFIVRIKNWRHQIQLEMENRRRQLKEPYRGKDLVSARWVLLTGFEKSQQLVLFTRRKKEISCCLCVLVICCLTSNAHHAGYILSMTRLLRTIFGLAGYRRYKAATNVLLYALLDPVRDPAKCFKFFSDKHCMQVATSSTFPSANDVIELCWILYNKTCIIATSFFQQTTAFELFLIERTYTSDILF